MKPAGWAILILSILLALSVGFLVYGKITTDAKIKAADDQVKAAQAQNTILEKQNADLQASKDAQIKLNQQQAATIASENTTIIKQSTVIVNLQAQVNKTQSVSTVTVAEGADLKQTYDAGKPVVSQISVSALTGWYDLLGTKIDPLLANVADLNSQVELLQPQVDFLNSTNADLMSENADLFSQNKNQKTLLDADTLKISQQASTISLQGLNLIGAQKNLDSAIHDKDLNADLAWTFGAAAAGAVVGSLGKDLPLDAGIGAVGSGVTMYGIRFLGHLFRWW